MTSFLFPICTSFCWVFFFYGKVNRIWWHVYWKIDDVFWMLCYWLFLCFHFLFVVSWSRQAPLNRRLERVLFFGQKKLWCFKVLWAIFHATLASLSRPWILQKSVGWDLRSVADTIGVFWKRFFQLWNPWFWEILKKLGRYIKLNRTCKMVVYVCLCFFCNILNGANN